jgi:hypothetical protein
LIGYAKSYANIRLIGIDVNRQYLMYKCLE